MSRWILLRYLAGSAILFAVLNLSSPVWSQHGHGGGGHGGGGHGGFGGGHHGGLGGGGHGGFGHYGGGHGGLSGHGYGGHYGGGSHYGYGLHLGSHSYSHTGLGHSYGHSYAGYGHGLNSYGHGGYLHGYGHYDYFPHSLYDHYPYYYDAFPYYGWYPNYSTSSYPWHGFYGVNNSGNTIVTGRVVTVADSPALRTTTRSTATSSGRDYQRHAKTAFLGGRFGEALRLANHALVETPRDGKLLLFVSQSLFATGDYRGAAAAIHQAASMLEQNEWGHVVKDWRNNYRGTAYKDAMDKLHEYVKKNPDAAYAYFLRGYHFGFLKNHEYARKQLVKAIKLEQRDRLAVELLKMFGGEPPANSSGEVSASEAGSGDDHTEHNHGTSEHSEHEASSGDDDDENLDSATALRSNARLLE